MTRILITGTAGFLGRTFARYYKGQGYEVYGVDRAAAQESLLQGLTAYSSTSLPGPRFEKLLEEWQPEVCLHCAGQASVPGSMLDPEKDYQDGPVLTFALLNALRQSMPNCIFVHLSSAAVYGNPVSLPVNEAQHLPAPISAYGYHKWQSELICQEFSRVFDMKTASARLFSAYGPGLRRQVIWDITKKALTEPILVLQGDGSESRDFVHAVDIARATEAIFLHARLTGEVYNIGSGKETTIGNLARMIVERLGRSIPLSFSGTRPPGTPKNWCADIDRLRSLGFQPEIGLKDGLEAFIDWCSQEVKAL